MERCRERFTDPRFTFVAADAADWVLTQGQPSTCFLSYGGVLEFFSQARLEQMWRHVAGSLAPSVVALVEPLAPDFDLARESRSRPYGLERSLCHNYPALLERYGFSIAWRREVSIGSQRWLLLVAERGAGPA